ncbi:MAG: CHAD domain-containing protein [Pseudomonadota bacterium]
MAYRLAADEPIDNGLRRIFLEEIQKVRIALDDQTKTAEQRVFKARKRLKRARSVVRLLKRPLGTKTQVRIADALRTVGRALALSRDADMLVTTADFLTENAAPTRRPIFAALGDKARLRVERIRNNAHTDMEDCRMLMRAAEADAQRLPLVFDAGTVFDEAFQRVYGRGRAYLQVASRTGQAEAFHDWRKYVKQRWHLSLLLREKRSADFADVIADLSQLGKVLGLDHDLAVLEQIVMASPTLVSPLKNRRLVRDTARRQQKTLRRRALTLARTLYRDPTDKAAALFASAYTIPEDLTPAMPPVRAACPAE